MHTIEPGDSYWKVSDKFNIDIHELQRLNNELGNILYSGNLMKIRPLSNSKTIKIKVNGDLLYPDQVPYLEDSTTFVPIRFIGEALNIDVIDWNGSTNTAILKNDDKTIKLPIGSNYAYINGTPIKLNAPISIYNGRTFVPIRFIAEAFKSTVYWDHSNYTVEIMDSENDLLWLARIVEAEAEGEPFEGKLAVANIILNRKNDANFPNTVKDVIFDTKFGIQFTPIANGKIYNNPSRDSFRAAESALKGENNIGDCLYFLNPDKATSSWIIENRSYYTQIANHNFYK